MIFLIFLKALSTINDPFLPVINIGLTPLASLLTIDKIVYLIIESEIALVNRIQESAGFCIISGVENVLPIR
ncbi:MAG: hypothetical protein ACOYKH_03345 [Brevefilum fermentans]